VAHSHLVKDIRTHYHDPKLQLMLERIIVNPIETPRGYKNPDTSMALRGPLSQFFSALYLKPLDRANLAARRTVFIANTHCSPCKDSAKSTRTSQIDDKRWDFFPTNHQLFASMVYVVG
jgi:hypothetical protein